MLHIRIPRGSSMTGQRIIIDWGDSNHWNNGKQSRCTYCRQQTLLLDDSGKPSHKVCAEEALAVLLGRRGSTAA